MGRKFHDMINEFISNWKNYLWQSFIASLVVFILLLILSLNEIVIIASVGATSFIVFAMPNSLTACPRNVIGGYIMGLLAGALCHFIPKVNLFLTIFGYAFAVGLSIFLMVVFDFEHPPASAIALGVAMEKNLGKTALAVIISAIVISIAYKILKPYLKDLV